MITSFITFKRKHICIFKVLFCNVLMIYFHKTMVIFSESISIYTVLYIKHLSCLWCEVAYN